MAIGTYQAEVFDAIVLAVSVDVVEFKRNWETVPQIPPALRALRRQPFLPEQSPVELVGRVSRAHNENLFEWARRGDRLAGSAAPGDAEKMRGIDAEFCDPSLHSWIIATDGLEAEPPNGFPKTF